MPPLKQKQQTHLKKIISESIRQALWETKEIQFLTLESRLHLVNEMIALDEAGWFDRAKDWVKGKALVNPSALADDPKAATRGISQSLQKATKAVVAFKADALRSSQTINSLHEAVLELFGKFFTSIDTIPEEQRGSMEREIMKVIGMYYTALMEEKKRIEAYVYYLATEVGAQGYNLAKSAEAMAGYKAPSGARVQGSRVVEPTEESSLENTPGMVGARA